MFDHLPECPQRLDGFRERCICSALRACEQRSYALGIEVGKHDGWIAGHAAGVQAARDAVAAVEMGGEHFWSVGFRDGITIALAAIDGLTQRDTNESADSYQWRDV